jgi:hypothetical protein
LQQRLHPLRKTSHLFHQRCQARVRGDVPLQRFARYGLTSQRPQRRYLESPERMVVRGCGPEPKPRLVVMNWLPFHVSNAGPSDYESVGLATRGKGHYSLPTQALNLGRLIFQECKQKRAIAFVCILLAKCDLINSVLLLLNRLLRNHSSKIFGCFIFSCRRKALFVFLCAPAFLNLVAATKGLRGAVDFRFILPFLVKIAFVDFGLLTARKAGYDPASRPCVALFPLSYFRATSPTPASVVRDTCQNRRGNSSKLSTITASSRNHSDDGLKLKGLRCAIALPMFVSTCNRLGTPENQKARSPFYRSIRAFGLDLAVCRLGVIHLRHEAFEASGCFVSNVMHSSDPLALMHV